MRGRGTEQLPSPPSPSLPPAPGGYFPPQCARPARPNSPKPAPVPPSTRPLSRFPTGPPPPTPAKWPKGSSNPRHSVNSAHAASGCGGGHGGATTLARLKGSMEQGQAGARPAALVPVFPSLSPLALGSSSPPPPRDSTIARATWMGIFLELSLSFFFDMPWQRRGGTWHAKLGE